MAAGFGTMNDQPCIIIGEREGWGNPQRFGIAAADERHHLYIIGKTGSGKTTLLRNLIIQHIALGHGVGVIDPHGDLAEELLHHIPPKRADHLVYFNPGNLEFPIGLNVLANVAPDDRHLVASGVVGAFKGIWRESWGPRLEYIFYDELKAYFTNPEAIASHLLNAHKNLLEKEQLLQVQKSEIAKVREQMKQTHELYLARQISVEGFGDIYRPLEQRLTELQSELPRLEGEIDAMKVNNVSADEVLSEANQLYARWPKLPVEDKRKIVEGILEKAVIGPGDEIELTLSYLPTSEEMLHSQQRLMAGFAAAHG